MPIITGSTTTSFSKFSIENLSISNLNAFSSLDFTADPSLFGLDVESKFVSGKINQSTLNFELSVKDPESLDIIEGGQINSESFSGITVDLYTTGNTRQLIRKLKEFLEYIQNHPEYDFELIEEGDGIGAGHVVTKRPIFEVKLYVKTAILSGLGPRSGS